MTPTVLLRPASPQGSHVFSDPRPVRPRDPANPDLGHCLAGRLVVWLLTHASALHVHVVHSSLIAVLAVVSVEHIRGEGQT